MPLGFDEAVPAVQAALKERGFGALTEIDVQATLRERLGADLEPYLIIGACNPRLAHQALEAEPAIGALLPCNVVVRAGGQGVIVEALDPATMSGLTGNADLRPVADEAAALIGEALSWLSQAYAANESGPAT